MSPINSSAPDGTIIRKCTLLGGTGYALLAGDKVDLTFSKDKLLVLGPHNISIGISYLEIVDISISGPGNVTNGGGFIGGGFGVEGAVEGMAIATVLNALTSRTKIHTFITLITHTGELHLHYGGMEPSALRIALSEVFTTLRRLDPAWLRVRLERLEFQRTEMRLNENEFEDLKQRLLFPPKRVDLKRGEDLEKGGELSTTPMGICPNCDSKIPLVSEMCHACTANFGPGAAWKVRPV
jgi:hypothetical protein